MKIVQELNMPKDEFYEIVKKSIEYDMKQHSKKKLEAGVEYNKVLRSYRGKEIDVTFSVVALSDDLIEFVTDSSKSKIRTTYSLEKSDQGVIIDYTEDLETPRLLESMNYKIMSFIYHKKNKKKMLNQWFGMEQYYIENSK
jgi:hypothetical protein